LSRRNFGEEDGEGGWFTLPTRDQAELNKMSILETAGSLKSLDRQ
jgi:hypothetical protein